MVLHGADKLINCYTHYRGFVLIGGTLRDLSAMKRKETK